MICGEGDAEIYVINQNLLRPFFPSLFSIQKMEELIYTTHRPRTQDWYSGDLYYTLGSATGLQGNLEQSPCLDFSLSKMGIMILNSFISDTYILQDLLMKSTMQELSVISEALRNWKRNIFTHKIDT